MSKQRTLRELMTDKQLIETLKNIKENCYKSNCNFCKFQYDNGACQIKDLSEELVYFPQHWDIERIEEIINENPI